MTKQISRRQFIKNMAYSATGLAALPLLSDASISNYQFNILNIPQQLFASKKGDSSVFNLTAQQGVSQFYTNLNTPTWGFNGAFLGPVLRAKKGDKVRIDVSNHLNEITTVHWHGMILPSKMDGGPHQEISPGQTWRSEYQIKQPGSTFFYHAHTHGKTGEQVYKGLGGMFIIDDDETMQKGLPNEYGVDDIPLILQDRDISSDGSMNYITFMPERMIGKHGKSLLVNGGVKPSLRARKTLLRFRLLNASNARFYNLHFNDNRPFQIIASDGGLLEKPITANEIGLAPAERYEILVDVSDRKAIMLQSDASLGNSGHGPLRMMGMDIDFNVLLIDPSSALKSEHKVPEELTQYADWSQKTIVAERNFDLQMGMNMRGGMRRGMGMMNNMMGNNDGGHRMAGMSINNESFDMSQINVRLKTNTFEIWNISNESPMDHPFHIHNTQFRILSRNGQQPAAHESGYKDTVIVNSQETVKILMPTGPYSDPDIPYMYHCHILEHEDAGMMGQFTVEA